MDLLDRLDSARERWSLLRHPFYQRWSAGELTREELAFYAAEYRRAVVALADASEAAADACTAGSLRDELDLHAREERAHVALWDRFADELAADTEREPLAETEACTRAWRGAADALEGMAVLYAVEANQPAVSQTKLDGLAAHYRIAAESPAAEYFALHSERDHEHAAQARSVLEERNADVDEERLAALAEGALAGNWKLLDGVERRFGR